MKLFKGKQEKEQQVKQPKQKKVVEPKEKPSLTTWMQKHPMAVGNVAKGILTVVFSAGAAGITYGIGKATCALSLTDKKTLGVVAASGVAVSGTVMTIDSLATLKMLKAQRKTLSEQLAAEELSKVAESATVVGDVTGLTDEEILEKIETTDN